MGQTLNSHDMIKSTLIRNALLVLGYYLSHYPPQRRRLEEPSPGTIRNAEGALEGASHVFLVKDRETQEIVQFAVSDAAGRFTMNAPAGTISSA